MKYKKIETQLIRYTDKLDWCILFRVRVKKELLLGIRYYTIYFSVLCFHSELIIKLN